MCKKTIFNNILVTLRTEICVSWGVSSKTRFVNLFGEYLKSEGIIADIKFNRKIKDKTNDFFIFQEYKGEDIAIYSNDPQKHPNAIHTKVLTLELFDDMKDLLKIDERV